MKFLQTIVYLIASTVGSNSVMGSTLDNSERKLGYPQVVVLNSTPNTITGEVSYAACSSDFFAGIPASNSWTATDGRGLCLINEIKANMVLPDGSVKQCESYGSSGTSYSQFAVLYNGGDGSCKVTRQVSRKLVEENSGEILKDDSVERKLGYPQVVVLNSTPNTITGEVSYAACSSDFFAGIPASNSWTATDSRGLCLINEIKANMVLPDGSVKQCESYGSSGTSYSQFAVIYNGGDGSCKVTRQVSRKLVEENTGEILKDDSIERKLYPQVVVLNSTPNTITGEVSYAACRSDFFPGISPSASWTPSASRGLCLINEIKANMLLSDGSVKQCESYGSSGTSYSQFAVLYNGGDGSCKVTRQVSRKLSGGLRGSNKVDDNN